MDEGQDFQQRPDGSTATLVGWILIAIGIIASLFSTGDDLRTSAIAFLFAQGSIGIGTLLISLGYIVKAIWFLPGRDIPMVVEGVVAPSTEECEWCGAIVDKPGLPCSAIALDQFEDGFKIDNDICREKLKERLAQRA